MSVIENYTNHAIEIAQDNRHGYSQQNRWGPDYDCSSLVITVLQAAGIPARELGATFTGNMREVLLSCGFKNVTAACNLVNGDGMRRGDILLNDANHTAIYIGNGQLVHARSSEGNSLQGDQSGNEIRVQSYYNYPWNIVLRYAGEEPEPEAPADQEEETASRSYALRIPYLRRGDTGDAVIAVQFQLAAQGYDIGPDGADGDFGRRTEAAVGAFQGEVGLTPDGVVGPETGARLFGGEIIREEDKQKAGTDAAAEPEVQAVEQTPGGFWNNLLAKIRGGGGSDGALGADPDSVRADPGRAGRDHPDGDR